MFHGVESLVKSQGFLTLHPRCITRITCLSNSLFVLPIFKGVREPEISGRAGNTKFFSGRVPENFEILEFIGKELGFGKGLGTSLNNSLKPTPSTISKGRRSRTIVRAIPSVISFGLTIFRVSFCTCDKFYIDSVSFLVHVLMFECICFKWRNKPVVFAYLVLNS